MDRTDVAAQQARLAEYRKQQEHTKQPEQSTSAAKKVDPKGQPFKDTGPVKPEFQKAHDHATVPEKSPRATAPREQDAARAKPSGMDGPQPPKSTGPEVQRQTRMEELKETHRQVKNRQEKANDDKMKDGKDHN